LDSEFSFPLDRHPCLCGECQNCSKGFYKIRIPKCRRRAVTTSAYAEAPPPLIHSLIDPNRFLRRWCVAFLSQPADISVQQREKPTNRKVDIVSLLVVPSTPAPQSRILTFRYVPFVLGTASHRIVAGAMVLRFEGFSEFAMDSGVKCAPGLRTCRPRKAVWSLVVGPWLDIRNVGKEPMVMMMMETMGLNEPMVRRCNKLASNGNRHPRRRADHEGKTKT
jgi:hypothetical protein